MKGSDTRKKDNTCKEPTNHLIGKNIGLAMQKITEEKERNGVPKLF